MIKNSPKQLAQLIVDELGESEAFNYVSRMEQLHAPGDTIATWKQIKSCVAAMTPPTALRSANPC